ncbi:DHA2 family efflux MFS transporter permease subunit [Candidatus Methylacidiphilum infernorum]|uniref:Permease of the major facilitator superfamily n=1 Tax=Methylacidiphilum infernorum (isolate V4) TaxID=481448 RepID=B3DY96_METI4|nr:DHA2 family efflux MFS transporter permease subunit [Candidatus Methylacidiphilum infernorum]ACD82373.1 Permease of the major facilitator superfamily [Methylacidiphilum infernorum V4]
MDGQSTNELAWKPRHNPWIIALSVMLATFMEVLDTTILNVALPYIAGGLAASNSQATWVLTSYLVSNAVVLPMTDWLGRTFGRKRLLIGCIASFTLSSALCGAAPNLGILILGRIIQGAGGGGLQPISQAILLESFPPEKRGQAMGLFALGVVVAPILGPVFGGWLTDNLNWRWCFFINLPVGILAIIASKITVEDPPYLQRNATKKLDILGFSFLCLWLGCLQVLLDKGQEDNWFDALWLRWMGGLSLLGMICFIYRELTTDNPIVDLKIFKDKNFAVAIFEIFIVGIVLYATLSGLPLFLQTLISYTAYQSGLAISPRGIGAVAGAIIAGRLLGVLSGRLIVALGFSMLALSSLQIGFFNLEIAKINIVIPNIINGIGAPFVFIPLTTAAVVTLRQEQIGAATGLFNLFRNIGGSVGTSMVQTFIQRLAQAHQTILVGYYTPDNINYNDRLSAIESYIAMMHGTVTGASQTLRLFYTTLINQANLLAYMEIFQFMGWICIFSIPLAFLLAKDKRGTRPGAGSLH